MENVEKKTLDLEENVELRCEELDAVTGGVMNAFQKAGIYAAVRLAKRSGYTLDDMEYIFDAARRAAEKGNLRDVTPEELESYIRSIWESI